MVIDYLSISMCAIYMLGTARDQRISVEQTHETYIPFYSEEDRALCYAELVISQTGYSGDGRRPRLLCY